MTKKTYRAKITLFIEIDINKSLPNFENKGSDSFELNEWFNYFKENENDNLTNLLKDYNVELENIDFGFFHPSQFT